MSRDFDAPIAIVVGTGFGCRIQVPALRASGFRVLGLVGTDLQRTAERAEANGVSEAFTDLDEAIARTGAHAVAVSTPPATHIEIVLKAIAHGCHVLCEKPFAISSEEAQQMLVAAERAGVTHVLGNEFRWDAPRNMAARLTARGAIGHPRFATFTQFVNYACDPNVVLPDWWFDKQSGGGWLGASGSHLVDWTRKWLGDFESVSAALTSVTGPAGGADDSFIVRFRSVDGVEGVLQQTAGAWGGLANMTRVAGSAGTIWIDGGKVWLADAGGMSEVAIDTDLILPPPLPSCFSTDPRQKSGEWQMLAGVELAPYIRLCEAWLAAIRGEDVGQPVEIPTFADGVANMAILDAIRASSANAGAVTQVPKVDGISA